MSEGSGQRRPPQVTWGAALAVVCGVLLVATAFDGLTGLRSVETRQRLARAIDGVAAGGVDLTVADATEVLHVLLLLAGGAAAVAAVLGGYAYTRHAGARAGLAVAAVLSLIGSMAADPLLGLLLVLGAGLLWSPPAREWFRPGTARPAGEGGTPTPPTPPTPPPSGEESAAPPPVTGRTPEGPRGLADGTPPPPTYGFGTPGRWPAAVGQPATEHPATEYPAGQPTWRRRRPPAPGSVKAAVALTWTCCLVALVAFVAAAAVLADDRARVVELLQQQPGYDRFADHEDALVAALWFLDGAFALWTLTAAVLAIFVLRGHDWARVLLLVSAGAAAAVALLAFPASVFHVVGSGVVLGLLLSRSATAWFRLPRR